MATPMQPPATKPTQAVCKICKRTTIIVTVAGERIPLDPEVITVVAYTGGGSPITARRKHGELCAQYARAEELRAMKMKKR